MSQIDSVLGNNAKFSAAFSGRKVPPTPSRRITIVSCMDARLDPAALLGLELGDAHVLRNAGGIVTDDVVRSLAISQRFLGTREVMLIHHTDCGLLMATEEEMKDAIESVVGQRPSFEMGAFADLEADVLASIARVEASPFVLHKDAIRGFVYEVETGTLREVDRGGRTV